MKHTCESCGATARNEYALLHAGGAGRTAPASSSAWLCSDECAGDYFGEKVEA
jgi:hypothetical protein